MSTQKQPSSQYLAFAEDFLCSTPDVEAMAEAATLANAQAFDPSGSGRPMKAWIVLGPEHQDRWHEFAEAAYRAVPSV